MTQLPPDSERFFGYKKSYIDLEKRIGKQFTNVPSNEWDDFLKEIEEDEKNIYRITSVSRMCKRATQTSRGSRLKRSD